MIVKLFRPTLPTDGDEPHDLYLEPESLADRKLLETLEREYVLSGFGRHAGDMSPLHAKVRLIQLSDK